ncbi:hypothetical protein [Marinoscillum furvescens]|uniref:GLPGLI family protein n=1 Tax=Marinoscillum furvescens DSM 4134 TaxID=1122208 RepID=A0A3D9L9L0_MARFU|nr:hypothetical protein [Marinoscillum furvescens]REE01752.1 hypothetical protein C7460_103269 [Marinoscillum furvescens DSM 4134]
MKKLAYTLLFVAAISFAGNAQELSEVFSTKGGYGEKKFKKAPKKAYIANFKVFFHVTASATAKSQGGRQLGGGSYRGNTSTTMTVAVDGVDIPDFQKITDEVYQRFVEDLKSNGYELITTAEAAGIPFYEDWELKDGGEVNYANLPGYVSVTPTGTQYLVKKETKKGREKKTFIDRTPRISKELDDAVVIEASFAFPFIEMKTNSSNMIGFSSVKAKTDFQMGSAFGMDGMTSLYEHSRVKFTSGSGPGASANAYLVATLKKPVPIEGVFKDEKFKEVSAASTTPAYYGVVFVTNKVDQVTNTASCDGDQYVARTTGLMNDFIDKTLTEFYGYAQ